MEDYLARLNKYVDEERPYPAARFNGRGIVICAGGTKYFTNAYVAASALRMHGCQLPIQFWHLGEKEMTDEMREIVRPLSVECVDGFSIRKTYSARILNGWELKPYAILHSPFQEVLFLDADNMAVRDPEYLFSTKEYKQHGAVFWPDIGRLGKDRPIWAITGIKYRDEPEFESGQIVVDKARCWKALNVTMHLNEWSDFYYRHVHGDKETFHLAWRKIAQEYAMPTKPVTWLSGCVFVQHDFEGKTIFQHRNGRKWTLFGPNDLVPGCQLEMECRSFLEKLRSKWSMARSLPETKAAKSLREYCETQRKFLYIRVGHDEREMELLPQNRIGQGAAGMEKQWFISEKDGAPTIQICGDADCICELTRDGSGVFSGQWRKFEKMPVQLVPMKARGWEGAGVLTEDRPGLEDKKQLLKQEGAEVTACFTVGSKLGDLIYALATVKYLGGGKLFYRRTTSDAYQHDDVLRLIGPLVRRQPYILAFEAGNHRNGLDLEDWRRRKLKNRGVSLAKAISLAAGAFDVDFTVPWIDPGEPRRTARVIINRTVRYQNPRFPWSYVLKKYAGEVGFVGLPAEHRAFVASFGDVPYIATADMLELAQVIKGADLFIGNQSSAYALAEAMKVNTIQEVCIESADCVFDRTNAVYGRCENVYIPNLSDRLATAICVHRLDSNIGDIVSAPSRYVPLPIGREADIFDPIDCRDRAVIVGGGGMFHPPFIDAIKKLVRQQPKLLIGWGIGINAHGESRVEYPPVAARFDLLGVRDWNVGFEWVPCASCLSSLFDSPPSVNREMAIYEHHQFRMPELSGDRLTNTASFIKVINHLASAEVVCTNTYHGVYWATLLGKRVISKHWASKFSAFRHPPTFLRDWRDWRGAAADAQKYPAARSECRKANLLFADKVKALLERTLIPTKADEACEYGEG